MISLQNISKSYQNNKALNQVSFTLKEGTCAGLLGPNGAGKSTLMKILASIIKQDEGKIDSAEMNLQNWKKAIGYVPQEICLTETLTAEQNLAFFGEIHQMKGKTLKNRMNDILADIGLEKNRKEKVSTFSGGMKRRLNIGCALMHDPRIILLDEPTVGIDPQSRNYILEMIRHMKQNNRIILYSSHYMDEVEKICDNVLFLDKGKMLLQKDIRELLETEASPQIFIKWKEDVALNTENFPNNEIREWNGGYQIKGNQPMEMMEEMLSYCREHHLTLEKLELVQPSLEEIFFFYTGEELRA